VGPSRPATASSRRPGHRCRVTAYYDAYDDLRTDQFTLPNLFPIVLRNGGEGETYGLEAWASFAPADWWRLRRAGTSCTGITGPSADFNDLTQLQTAGLDPNYQAQLRSNMQLASNLELDLALRRVGDVKTVSGTVNAPAYTEADVRLGWRVREGLELSVERVSTCCTPTIWRSTTARPRRRERSPARSYVGLRWGF